MTAPHGSSPFVATKKKPGRWFGSSHYFLGWIGIAAVLGIIVWIASLFFSKGAGRFILCLLLAATIIGILSAVKKKMVPLWTTVIALFIPIFCWFFWGLKPLWYNEWRGSTFFPLFILSAMFIAWLSSNKNDEIARVARFAMIALCITAIGIGGASKWHSDKDVMFAGKNGSDTIFVDGHPHFELKPVAPTINADFRLKYMTSKGESKMISIVNDGSPSPTIPGHIMWVQFFPAHKDTMVAMKVKVE